MNNKFPALDFYRLAMNLVGVLIVGGGFLLGLSLSQVQGSYGNQTNFITFGVTFGISVVFALGLLVSAELIKLFIRIENHLDTIRRIEERNAGLENANFTPTLTQTSSSAPESEAMAYNLGSMSGTAVRTSSNQGEVGLSQKMPQNNTSLLVGWIKLSH